MKKNYAPIAVGAVLVFLYALSLTGLSTVLRNGDHRMESMISRIPPKMATFFAGEFKGIVADYALIEAATIFGKADKVTPEEWETIANLFTLTMELDPFFMQSYHLIDATLPWFTQKYDLSVSLLEKSKNSRFWDWIPGYFLGFEHFYFLKDNAKAASYLMEAAKIENAPEILATFGARLANEAGNNETALIFLKAYYEKEEDEEKKEIIAKRIRLHEAVALLEEKIILFKNDFRRYPTNLMDLIIFGYLNELPLDQYSKTFNYDPDSGKVLF
ncbi:MAG: hypothetical protein GY737_11630 [Desulfobacteraceae bacterium]|nr:hypothetical protein [Desulfobacteraceae bacterium]